MKLVKWLANQADDVAASADDLKRFGPKAARVRSLLDFLPTMSDDAVDAMYKSTRLRSQDALEAAREAASIATANSDRRSFREAARSRTRRVDAGNIGYDAARAEIVSDIISPENYRTLTNPLAVGRATDVLGNRPRNQGLPFYNIVRQLGDSGILKTPRDVVIASRLAKLPDNVLETALTILTDPNSTFTLQDLKGLLSSARLLA